MILTPVVQADIYFFVETTFWKKYIMGPRIMTSNSGGFCSALSVSNPKWATSLTQDLRLWKDLLIMIQSNYMKFTEQLPWKLYKNICKYWNSITGEGSGINCVFTNELEKTENNPCWRLVWIVSSFTCVVHILKILYVCFMLILFCVQDLILCL